MRAPIDDTRGRTAADIVSASVVGWIVAGAWVTWLTLGLNPQLHGSIPDRAVLLLFVEAFFLSVGAVLGLLLALAQAVLPGRSRWRHTLVTSAALIPGPLYALLLPGSGIDRSLLVDILAPHRRDAMLLHLGILGFAVLLAAGVLTVGAALAERAGVAVSRRHVRRIGALAAGLAMIAPLMWPLPGDERDDRQPLADAVQPATVHPDPVVVLCVDGADLDDVVLPMVRAGRLPTLERLVRDGVTGPLETLDPSLSPVVWTTLATGTLPERHGIEHFLYTKLPGMTRPIRRFPLATGFNFHLVGVAERIPGVPPLRHAYTSTMRRTRALWDIAREHVTVGVYRWLITWPAEPVNGFNIAEGVVVDLDPAGAGGGNLADRPGRTHPPDVDDRMGGVAVPEPSLDEMAAFLGTSADRLEGHSDLGVVRDAMRDPTRARLEQLRAAFRPVLTLANFYSVDAFNHSFGRAWRAGDGPFARALPARYRQLDGELARLMTTFERPTNVLVISDHGYDFDADHHVHAPAGMFLAAGPAFRRGAAVEGLSVVDVAPLVLRLLGLPVAEDLPGTRRGAYRRVLTPDFREQVPERRIATWERPRGEAPRGGPTGDDTRTIEQLRALGYIE